MESNNVIIDGSSLFTTEKLYNNVYYNQLLEIMKIALAFLISTIIVRVFDISIFNYFQNNKLLYFVLLIIMLISIILIGTKLFTYVKVTNDKDDLLKKLI